MKETIVLDLDKCGDGLLAFNIVRPFPKIGKDAVANVLIDAELLALAKDTKAFLNAEFEAYREALDQMEPA